MTWTLRRPVLFLYLACCPLLSRADTVFPAGLCGSLSQPTAEELQPFLDAETSGELARHQSHVKKMTIDAADGIIREAANRGWTSLDLFTEEAIRGECLYFIPRNVLSAIDRRFNLNATAQINGRDENGDAFAMAGFFVGRSRHFIFYNRDSIVVPQPDAPDNPVRLRSVLLQRVVGDGHLNISGMSVKVGGRWLDIQASKKVSAREIELTIGMGRAAIKVKRPILPIEIRPQPRNKSKNKSTGSIDSVSLDPEIRTTARLAGLDGPDRPVRP
ncbi:MAG: hypothetical protein HYT79_08435 [Elusimicrobia bacterium]|nr:hypothetical protein [Elusimicrobiota bacterium]